MINVQEQKASAIANNIRADKIRAHIAAAAAAPTTFLTACFITILATVFEEICAFWCITFPPTSSAFHTIVHIFQNFASCAIQNCGTRVDMPSNCMKDDQFNAPLQFTLLGSLVPIDTAYSAGKLLTMFICFHWQRMQATEQPSHGCQDNISSFISS